MQPEKVLTANKSNTIGLPSKKRYNLKDKRNAKIDVIIQLLTYSNQINPTY